MKFLHTLAAMGLAGSMVCLIVMLQFLPAPSERPEYALMTAAMAGIANWVFLPSLALTLIAGLIAIALNRSFHSAGWAWAKLASGIVIFEWGLTGVQGVLQEQAELAAEAASGGGLPATGFQTSEQGSLWVLLAVAVANVVLGVWRPRLTNLPD